MRVDLTGQEREELALMRQEITIQKSNIDDLEKQLEIRKSAQESEASSLRENLEKAIQEKNLIKADLLREKSEVAQQKSQLQNSRLTLDYERQNVNELRSEANEKWKQCALMKHSAGKKLLLANTRLTF